MKTLLRLEEAVLFLAGIYLFSFLKYSWWVFPILVLTPDVSMIGYMINKKFGAYLYNIFHTRIIGVVIMVIGLYLNTDSIMLAGIILFSHCAMDRMLHYGLKYTDSFKHTHLGPIL